MNKELKDSVVDPEGFFGRVAAILEEARGNVVRAVNSNMVIAYWLIGREIVQELQGGEERAAYGQTVVADLSQRLNECFGKGFAVPNLLNFRKFYLADSNRISISSRIQYPMGTKSSDVPIQHPTGAELAVPQISLDRASSSNPIPSPTGRKLLLQGSSPQLSWSLSRVLMRAVKRNIEQYPDDFMFVLANKTVTDLRHQFGISSWVELV